MTKKELQKTETEELKLEVDMEELQELASMRCTPLRLRDMYKYAIDFNNQEQRLLNAQFLHKELPIRVAQRAVDLLTLPHGLSEALPTSPCRPRCFVSTPKCFGSGVGQLQIQSML